AAAVCCSAWFGGIPSTLPGASDVKRPQAAFGATERLAGLPERLQEALRVAERLLARCLLDRLQGAFGVAEGLPRLLLPEPADRLIHALHRLLGARGPREPRFLAAPSQVLQQGRGQRLELT